MRNKQNACHLALMRTSESKSKKATAILNDSVSFGSAGMFISSTGETELQHSLK